MAAWSRRFRTFRSLTIERMSIRDWLRATVYVRIGPEKISIRDVRRGTMLEEVAAIAIGGERGKKQVIAVGSEAVAAAQTRADLDLYYPFRHPRVPFGDYTLAEKLLQHLVRRFVNGNGFPKPMVRVVVHPLHKLEGGLTQIENRAFRELVENAGARQVVLYEGVELSDRQVDDALFEKLRDR